MATELAIAAEELEAEGMAIFGGIATAAGADNSDGAAEDEEDEVVKEELTSAGSLKNQKALEYSNKTPNYYHHPKSERGY